MIILGLTGSIGMGKSTTAQMFRDAGAPVFDADAVVHSLYQGAAVEVVEAAFPGVAHDGMIDRQRLAARVLADPDALRRLEALVHPLVAAERGAFLEAARLAGTPVALLDIPLLFETGGEGSVDAVAVVSAPEPVQKARVMARPGMTAERLSAILAKQTPDSDKRRRADFVIETGDGLESARRQVGTILAELRGRATTG